MELRQLKYLIAIAETGSFTAAARASRVAQPALSQQVAKLERELGVRLAERTVRGAELTEAGHLAVVRARAALREVDALAEEVSDVAGLRRGRLRLGITPTPGPINLAASLAAFQARYPRIEVELRERLSADLVAALRERRIDLAYLTGLRADELEGVSTTLLARERLVCVVPPTHELSGRRRVTITALLRTQTFVCFGRGATIRRELERFAAAEGLDWHPAYEVSDARRARDLVSAGLGVALLPASDVARPGPPVTTLGITPALAHQVSIAYPAARDLPPTAQAFLQDALLGMSVTEPPRASP